MWVQVHEPLHCWSMDPNLGIFSDSDWLHSNIGFISVSGPPTLAWRDNQVSTGFPLPEITLLNNFHHSWILNLLAAFSANQQSGTRLNKFYPDGAFIFYQIFSCIFLKIHIGTPKVKTWNQDSRSLRILSRECVFVFLCEFALFGPDLVSPFLGITLSRRAQILSEICRIVCLWKRQDIFPIHK